MEHAVASDDPGRAATESVERSDADVLIEHGALRVMGLKRNRAGTGDSPAGSLAPTVPVGWLRPAHDRGVVDLHHNRVTFDDDRLGEPLAVFDRRVVEIDDVVETAG